MKVNFDFGGFEERVQSRAEDAMSESLDLAKEELEKYTPEDEGELVAGYEIEEPKMEDGILVGRVVNKVRHGIYVNFGVGGKRYRYNKPKGTIFYVGVGARMMEKTKDYNADRFKKIFLKHIR